MPSICTAQRPFGLGTIAIRARCPIVVSEQRQSRSHPEFRWPRVTDIPLTAHGESDAKKLAGRLQGLSVAKVFTSPLQRARRTCELAGFGSVARIDPDLMEWNYGAYEGKTTADMANGPVQRIQPWPEALALLEKLGAKNNHKCVSC